MFNIFKKKPKEFKLHCQWCGREIYIGEKIETYETDKIFDDGAVEAIVVHKHCEHGLPELIKQLEK